MRKQSSGREWITGRELDVTTYVNCEDFCEKNPGAKIYMATTKGRHVYTEVSYEPDCYIMFGKESAGIPEEILKANPDTCVRIPMIGETRSLNLSNSVAIVLYEALRQNEFDHMKLQASCTGCAGKIREGTDGNYQGKTVGS